jgi:hypothetical protein
MCINSNKVESKLCELILDMTAVSAAVNEPTEVNVVKQRCDRLYSDWQELKTMMKGIEELEGPDYDAIVHSFLE